MSKASDFNPDMVKAPEREDMIADATIFGGRQDMRTTTPITPRQSNDTYQKKGYVITPCGREDETYRKLYIEKKVKEQGLSIEEATEMYEESLELPRVHEEYLVNGKLMGMPDLKEATLQGCSVIVFTFNRIYRLESFNDDFAVFGCSGIMTGKVDDTGNAPIFEEGHLVKIYDVSNDGFLPMGYYNPTAWGGANESNP